MVSLTSASRYITSASCYHLRYQSRSSMYIRGLVPRNFAKLAEAVPIDEFSLGSQVILLIFHALAQLLAMDKTRHWLIFFSI